MNMLLQLLLTTITSMKIQPMTILIDIKSVHTSFASMHYKQCHK